jgi:hypothetical protein
MPADFVFKLFMSLVVLNLLISWLFSLSMLAGHPSRNYLDWESNAQRESIRRRIWDPLYRWQRVSPMDSELGIYTHCFYGYGLIGLAACQPPGRRIRIDVVSELERLIPVAEAEAMKEPFRRYTKLKPQGGVIPAGNINLLRAGYLLLGGANPGIINDFHKHTRELYEAFTEAPVPFLESAPEMIWPNDSSAALDSLRWHDKLFGTSYDRACVRAEKWLQAHLDPQSGMMNIQIDRSGRRLDVPRGCGLSWSLAFMPGYAPGLARQQYSLFRQKWFVPVLGMYGIREWWPGQEKYSIIPSGPVIADIGWAASGLGIAAAHANGDLEGWLGLRRGLDLLGLPSINYYGQKSYCGELFLLADVMAFWSRTTCAWDNPALEEKLWHAPPSFQNPQSGSFVCILAPAYLFALLVSFFLVRETVVAWKTLQTKFPIRQWQNSSKAFLVIQSLLALTVLFVPLFLWPAALFSMLMLKFVEKFLAKQRGTQGV